MVKANYTHLLAPIGEGYTSTPDAKHVDPGGSDLIWDVRKER